MSLAMILVKMRRPFSSGSPDSTGTAPAGHSLIGLTLFYKKQIIKRAFGKDGHEPLSDLRGRRARSIHELRHITTTRQKPISQPVLRFVLSEKPFFDVLGF
jgi:tRNA A-37 threonylcarbamoyl transferase component Bud32